jgi:hypothetical protein
MGLYLEKKWVENKYLEKMGVLIFISLYRKLPRSRTIILPLKVMTMMSEPFLWHISWNDIMQ